MTVAIRASRVAINHIDGEDRVSHRVIAEGTQNQVKNVVELISTYKAELEEFGVVAFQTEAVSYDELKLNPDSKPKQQIYLNEQQATLLIALMKNSEIVVRFKVALVKAFYELKNNRGSSFTLPKTYKDALKELVLKVEEIEALENKIEEQKPLVTYAETVSTAVNGVTLREWVGMMKQENGLKVGEQKVISFLIDQKYLYRNGSGKLIPYANRFDYFSTEPIIIATPKGNKEFPSLKITGKGQVSLVEKVLKHFS